MACLFRRQEDTTFIFEGRYRTAFQLPPSTAEPYGNLGSEVAPRGHRLPQIWPYEHFALRPCETGKVLRRAFVRSFSRAIQFPK